MFNKVILTGRLTADAELKTTPSGVMVTSFTIANDSGYGDNKKTNFINIVAWRSTAEFIAKYFSKGSLIGIEGAIQTRSYEDKDGKKRSAFEVLAEKVHFMESKKDKQETADNYYSEASNEANYEVITDDDELPF